jgi:uncharacterized membrane protein (DUF485 family)
MITSFFLIFLFCFTGIWAFTEHIGDGSWNERIFVGSGIGILVAIATFIISVIWGFIKR